jgi:hypothetical protein
MQRKIFQEKHVFPKIVLIQNKPATFKQNFTPTLTKCIAHEEISRHDCIKNVCIRVL